MAAYLVNHQLPLLSTATTTQTVTARVPSKRAAGALPMNNVSMRSRVSHEEDGGLCPCSAWRKDWMIEPRQQQDPMSCRGITGQERHSDPMPCKAWQRSRRWRSPDHIHVLYLQLRIQRCCWCSGGRRWQRARCGGQFGGQVDWRELSRKSRTSADPPDGSRSGLLTALGGLALSGLRCPNTRLRLQHLTSRQEHLSLIVATLCEQHSGTRRVGNLLLLPLRALAPRGRSWGLAACVHHQFVNPLSIIVCLLLYCLTLHGPQNGSSCADRGFWPNIPTYSERHRLEANTSRAHRSEGQPRGRALCTWISTRLGRPGEEMCSHPAWTFH